MKMVPIELWESSHKNSWALWKAANEQQLAFRELVNELIARGQLNKESIEISRDSAMKIKTCLTVMRAGLESIDEAIQEAKDAT